jgi:tyrosine-protein phosphatase YwqE
MLSWFNRFFKREGEIEPVDLSVLKVDLHSHLIPGIDDGAVDLENSMKMLQGFARLGYKKVITTPHIMSDFYRNTPEIINEGKARVKKEIEKTGLDMKFDAAAEYYLDETLEDKISIGEVLTMGDKYFLFELPFMAEPPNLNQIIFLLQTNGYKPILAHPERYGFWYSKFEKYRELKDKGVHLQLNMLSLIGHYSPETRKIAEQMIDEGLISFLGSDCHNLQHLELIEIARRKPYLKKLIESGHLLNQSLLN